MAGLAHARNPELPVQHATQLGLAGGGGDNLRLVLFWQLLTKLSLVDGTRHRNGGYSNEQTLLVDYASAW